MTTHIYTLLDEAGAVRYVGKTANQIGKRLQRHLRVARSGASGHRNNWIRSVLGKGFVPEIRLLESVSGNGSETECKWIACFRAKGIALCNCTDGGEGTSGLVFSQDHRKKISQALTGIKRSKETRKLIRLARANQPPAHTSPHSESTKQKIRVALAAKEVRENIGAANRGRRKTSKEIRRNRNANRLAWSDPKKRSEQAERTRQFHARTH
jgi:hypothetical protein